MPLIFTRTWTSLCFFALLLLETRFGGCRGNGEITTQARPNVIHQKKIEKKKNERERKGKAKLIHFIIRWSQLFCLALALFYLTCQVFMECHPCVWNCTEHKITKMPGGLSGKWLASTPSLMKWHILRDAYHVCVCCLIFWHVLQLTLGNLFFGTPSRQSCSIWTQFKSGSQIINNRQGVKNVSLPAGGLWWEITCTRPSK